MHVLMWSDRAYEVIPGGHQVQLDRTVEALKNLDVEVTISTSSDERLDDVDLVHSIGAAARGIRRARAAGIPVVASPIYVSRRFGSESEDQLKWRHKATRAARIASSVMRRGVYATAAQVVAPTVTKQLAFESADLLLPNSHAEAADIRAELGVSTPMHVVPNAADHRIFVPPLTNTSRSGVLYVGRIEPHKNQLGLIRALAGTGTELTIVGDVHPDHQDYWAACRRAADSRTTFVHGQSQGGLVEFYQRAAVHAMPSWYETTGLASLEAALCGASIVTTSRGYAREYFADLAHYCDPANRLDIRAAVARALHAGPCERLRAKILANFTWDHTARATVDGYNSVLAHPSPY